MLPRVPAQALCALFPCAPRDQYCYRFIIFVGFHSTPPKPPFVEVDPYFFLVATFYLIPPPPRAVTTTR